MKRELILKIRTEQNSILFLLKKRNYYLTIDYNQLKICTAKPKVTEKKTKKQVAAPAAYGSSRARGSATATVEAKPSSYVVSRTGSPKVTLKSKTKDILNKSIVE